MGGRGDRVTPLPCAQVLAMDPIERFIYLSAALSNGKGHFNPHYIEWRHKRQAKLLGMLGDSLQDIRVLALGDGIGDMGGFVAALGADVVALEGRAENVAMANLRMRGVPYTSEIWDLRDDFTTRGPFDIVLNLGLLEVIDNAADIMHWSTMISDRIIIDTLVCDSDECNISLSKETAKRDDGSLRGIGSRPTPSYIEQFHVQRGYTVHRHWTTDLNSGPHLYDWEPKHDGAVNDGKRRFWEFRK